MPCQTFTPGHLSCFNLSEVNSAKNIVLFASPFLPRRRSKINNSFGLRLIYSYSIMSSALSAKVLERSPSLYSWWQQSHPQQLNKMRRSATTVTTTPLLRSGFTPSQRSSCEKIFPYRRQRHICTYERSRPWAISVPPSCHEHVNLRALSVSSSKTQATVAATVSLDHGKFSTIPVLLWFCDETGLLPSLVKLAQPCRLTFIVAVVADPSLDEIGPIQEYDIRVAQERLRNDPHQRGMYIQIKK